MTRNNSVIVIADLILHSNVIFSRCYLYYFNIILSFHRTRLTLSLCLSVYVLVIFTPINESHHRRCRRIKNTNFFDMPETAGD
jgi:hypothetical protein